MIASLTGQVTSLTVERAVIDVGGVGIAVQVMPSTRAMLTLGSTVVVHTSLVVREESLTLYAFLDADERDLFEIVQSATGVGPKLAQAMLSVHAPDQLRNAVLEEDLRALEMVPGIGRKGAQRIVLELKDRIGPARHQTPSGSTTSPWRDQVHAALVGLGFSAREATEAIDVAARDIAPNEADDVPAILRRALRSRGRG